MSTSSPMEVVIKHWGEDAPDWVIALAKACERSSQGKVAKVVGYSAGAVNTVLHNRYKAKMDGIEAKVRGALMAETVDCHHIGEIGRHVCASWRAKWKAGQRSNTLQIQMARACANCPLYADEAPEQAEPANDYPQKKGMK